MKIKRNKKAERYMSLYKNNFGFRVPYQILLDGTFCQVALQHKVNIQDQLPKYLSGECKLLTTACVIEETKKLGKQIHGAYVILTQFPVHNCGHEKPLSATTQDYQLRKKVSKLVVCPLIKLANNALVMEQPTKKVRLGVDKRHDVIANRMHKRDVEVLEKLKKDLGTCNNKDDETAEIRKKRKRIRGPNPLSCKKASKPKKTINDIQINCPDEDESTKKRRRKKIKIARHVQKFLMDNSINNDISV